LPAQVSGPGLAHGNFPIDERPGAAKYYLLKF
jgi:hypothetical protein